VFLDDHRISHDMEITLFVDHDQDRVRGCCIARGQRLAAETGSNSRATTPTGAVSNLNNITLITSSDKRFFLS